MGQIFTTLVLLGLGVLVAVGVLLALGVPGGQELHLSVIQALLVIVDLLLRKECKSR